MASLISAIVPVLNGEKFLKNFDTKVLSHSTLVEFIFVCSKSSDKSAEILLGLDKDFENISVVFQDSNVYEAMNIGTLHSSSKYLIFLGVDDALIQNDLIELLNFLDTTNAPMVLGKVRMHNNHTKKTIEPKLKKFPAAYHHQSILFNKNFISRNKIKYDYKYKIHSDFDFIQKIIISMKTDESVQTVDLSVALVRAGGMSSSGRHFRTSLIEIFTILKKYKGLMRLESLIIFTRIIFYFIRRYK